MNEGAESHSIGPAARKVGDVDVLNRWIGVEAR